MTREEFKKLTEKLIILDGATGSNLQKRGMPNGVCPEKWVVDHRDIMIQLQKEYVEAGTHILYAPTFSGNRIKLAEYGLEQEIEYLNKTLVAISREAAEGKALIAADLTMTGEQLEPLGTMTFEELVLIYKEQIGYLAEAGVDLLVIETMMSLQETRAALIAAKECCDLPVMITMTFNEDGRTLYGTTPEVMTVVLQSLGADAIGINCSTGPDKMLPMIEKIKAYAKVPVIAKPNAGLPFLDKEKNTAYDMEVSTFVQHMKQLVEAGAGIIGGCCGTTPEFIAAVAKELKTLSPKPVEGKKKGILTTERSLLEIDQNGRFLLVGERINPTGKKELQKDLKEHEYEMVISFAEEQKEAGASILDINMGMNGIDEKEVMLEVLSELSMSVDIPLCIDSSHVHVIEAALRNYPGRALINSISLEEEKFHKLIPIAKKYGAMFILLPLSDKGIPKTAKEKIDIINTIVASAVSHGIPKEDIIVDGLVATVGANKNAAIETLETIRYCKKDLGLATIVGLSNISFGLPDRAYINSAFLVMAIKEGLTMAIANPSQDLLIKSAFAADLLLNKEEADIAYIHKVHQLRGEIEKPSEKKSEFEEGDSQDYRQQIYDEVLKGSRKTIVETVKAAVLENIPAGDILNGILIPAINEVGQLFDKQVYFLPQLIASAETMKKAIEYLEPLLEESSDGHDMPVIVIATVEGDIHDIGKNLVGMMLKNYGYQVVDLGKDVTKEEIVKTAKEKNASIIGLSALMTTTMQEMKNVISYAKEQGCNAKIIIGGAVINQGYADEIGADGFSKDAADAVRLVKELLNLK